LWLWFSAIFEHWLGYIIQYRDNVGQCKTLQDSAGQFNLGIQDSASDRRFRAVQGRTMQGTAGQCMIMTMEVSACRTMQDNAGHFTTMQGTAGNAGQGKRMQGIVELCAGHFWAVKDFKGTVPRDF
jgi:hypothetical protein